MTSVSIRTARESDADDVARLTMESLGTMLRPPCWEGGWRESSRGRISGSWVAEVDGRAIALAARRDCRVRRGGTGPS